MRSVNGITAVAVTYSLELPCVMIDFIAVRTRTLARRLG